jgi:hypothetical protein
MDFFLSEDAGSGNNFETPAGYHENSLVIGSALLDPVSMAASPRRHPMVKKPRAWRWGPGNNSGGMTTCGEADRVD